MWIHTQKIFIPVYLYPAFIRRPPALLLLSADEASHIIMPGITFLFLFVVFFSSAVTNVTHVFLKHESHYLDVPKVGTFTVVDIFDCTFECLKIPMCVSVNLAVSKRPDGKLWCELLSSDKYRNFLKFKGNESSHHLSIKVRAVISFPCQLC